MAEAGPAGAARRRLRRLDAQLSRAGRSCECEYTYAPTSADSEPGPENGVGPIRATPPLFALTGDGSQETITQFFDENGFVLIADALNDAELTYLNGFCDATRQTDPELWGIGHPLPVESYAQPLLDFPELDKFAMHPATFPLIRDRFCGGESRCKFCQFDFRHTPRGAGRLANRIHRDLPNAVCSIHYLTDVSPDTPAFAVVPKSFDRSLYSTVADAQERMPDYCEVPIYAPAGTCVIYKTDLFHCRWDGATDAPRRTMQEYFYAVESFEHPRVDWVVSVSHSAFASPATLY